MGKLWIAITILGPVLLGAVMLWAMVRNRKPTRGDAAHTERGTHELYAEEDRIARADDAVDHIPVDRPHR